MNRLLYIIISILISNIGAFAQIQYAMVIQSPLVHSPQIAGGNLVNGCTLKNRAQISNAIIKLKGEDWYINHILNNESSPKKISYYIKCYSDTIIVGLKDRLKIRNPELGIVLNEVCEYLYLHQCRFYISNPNRCKKSNNKIDSAEYVNNIRNYIDIKRQISTDVNMEFILLSISNGFIGTIEGTTKFYYDRYYKKEIQQGNIPLSHIEWIKSLIDYYLNVHIESSLDYGIDNTAFQIKPTQ